MRLAAEAVRGRRGVGLKGAHSTRACWWLTAVVALWQKAKEEGSAVTRVRQKRKDAAWEDGLEADKVCSRCMACAQQHCCCGAVFRPGMKKLTACCGKTRAHAAVSDRQAWLTADQGGQPAARHVGNARSRRRILPPWEEQPAQRLYAVGMVMPPAPAAAVAPSRLCSAAGPSFSRASTVAICGGGEKPGRSAVRRAWQDRCRGERGMPLGTPLPGGAAGVKAAELHSKADPGGCRWHQLRAAKRRGGRRRALRLAWYTSG